jgi:MFS family permease
VNLIWATIGIGSFLVARRWGRVTDIHGHRPILVICTAFKPVVCIAFLLITPRWAMLLLPLVFLFDSMANAGILVAINSYMLKAAPKTNRSMFAAAVLALAGLCGGVASIVAGWAVDRIGPVQWEFFGRTWINYHALFAVSIVARFGAWYMATRVREPEATEPMLLLSHVRGSWPGVFLEYPVGLYRRIVSRVRRDESD